MLTLALWALLAEAPLYTNDDLERVAPYHDQTGVFTVPAARRADKAPVANRERSQTPAPRGEEYWRREAERTRDRVQRLRDRQDALRERLAAQQQRPRKRTASLSDGARTQALEQAIAALETRIREEEGRLEDRARREGALPGWLR
jgi:chromosome segregation ATPase